ncbi:tyrosine-type recombinase/integrase [Spirosoma jeollabukense]
MPLPAKRPDDRSPSPASAPASYTVSRLIAYFASTLPASSNYPRHARAYLDYCLQQGYGVDGFSLGLYATGFRPNRISPLRKFLFFYQQLGYPQILLDPPKKDISPAANELVLRFIREHKGLKGERSKQTYTQALNAFFHYIDVQLQQGRPASLTGLTVNDYITQLNQQGKSPFTINIYLSPVKQLAAWCVLKRKELALTPDQVESLQDVQAVKGFTVERRFYKESLEANERTDLLASAASPRDRAILALLSLEGLRTVEITRLLLADVDVDRRLIHVLGKGKSTKKPIKLFEACLGPLVGYLQSIQQWPLPEQDQKTPLFANLTTAQVRYITNKHLLKNGLKKKGMSAHSLRHTAAQLLLDGGVELVYVQQHLRHESIETTQFYTLKQTLKTYFQKLPN